MGSLIHYTTNPGEYDDLEGVVVSEGVPAGYITGADRNGVVVAGETLKGPVDVAVAVGGEQEFENIFGHYTRPNSTVVVNKVRQFLLVKPFAFPLVIVRAAAAAAAIAEKDFSNVTPTAIVNIAASSPGAWGADLTAAITAATDGNANHWNLTIAYRGKSITYVNLDTTTGNNNLLSTIGNDNEVLVSVTKLADGRPLNIAATALTDTAGSDGSIADTDFSASNRALDVAAVYPGVSVLATADRCTATVKAAIKTLADAAVDRMFVMWSGTHGDSVSTVITDVASYRSDRIIYLYNSAYIMDPELGAEIQVPPHSFMASALSQTDVNWSVANARRTGRSLGGIRRLTRSLSRADLISLKNAGICALEQLSGGGFKFRSPVTTSLTVGLTDIARRRCADFLQLSVAARLQDYIEEEDTETVNGAILAEIDAFCADLRDQERVVKDYTIIGEATNAAGVKVLKWRVGLIKHLKFLVLETEIGTGLTFEVAQAA